MHRAPVALLSMMKTHVIEVERYRREVVYIQTVDEL